MKLSAIKANPKNPRLIRDEKFDRLKKSLESFPQMMELRPIVVDGDGVILGGNMRYQALKALGKSEIPDEWVKRADELTEEQKREFVIKDNAGFGEWDWDLIANEWDDLPLEDWGLDVPTFEAIEEAGTSDAEPQIDKAAELNEKWKVETGDLWQIGEHRLLCGDSTKREDVERLLDGTTPNLMVTDPPYGVELDQSWRDKALGSKALGKFNLNVVDNDDTADWTLAWQLFEGNIAYVWHASKFSDVVMASLRSAGFEPCQQLIWNKSVMVLGHSDYHYKHEPCCYAIRRGKAHDWIGDRTQTTVIDAAPPKHIMAGSQETNTPHPTQKPINCFLMVANHSGDVYEPFAGSGTTLVACQNLNRKCYAIEINPKYCAVILERMQTAFPDLEIKRIEQRKAESKH